MCDDTYCEGHEYEESEMDDAADARHDTPYVYNPFKTAGPKATQLVLDELRRSEVREQERAAMSVVVPETTLQYRDPAGHFVCAPALPTFTGEDLSILDLRVMAAHLATALDTVNAELKRRIK